MGVAGSEKHARGKSATNVAWAPGWALRPREKGLNGFATCPAPLRGSEGRLVGKPWTSFVTGTGGLTGRRCDRCPVGLCAHGLSVRGVAVGQREGNSRIPVRIEGACAGRKGDVAQRAEVGYRPCCARPTHIAVPSRYVGGEFSPQKAREISLRTERGTWPGRCFAACLFAQQWGVFRLIGTGRRDPRIPALLLSQAAHLGPCRQKALRPPPLRMWITIRIPN